MMTRAIAAGLSMPFQWLTEAFSPLKADAPSVMKSNAAGICHICHERTAAATDHQCMDCWLDCNAAP